MSDLKVAASRENGAKSAGPKTQEGRDRASQNALKLGIFSQRRLLEGESEEDFRELREALCLDLAPVGALETHYVDQIAGVMWRKRRLERAEIGTIRRERTEFCTVC
jgi:hypothetical protein